MPQRFRWACAPFCELLRVCRHREGRCPPAFQRADPAARLRLIASRDLPENRGGRESFPGPLARASLPQGTELFPAREGWRDFRVKLLFVWPRCPLWVTYANKT